MLQQRFAFNQGNKWKISLRIYYLNLVYEYLIMSDLKLDFTLSRLVKLPIMC